MRDARKNSVSQLAELYNVVIGVALSAAIYNLVDAKATPIPLHLDCIINLFSILVTIIPFYHGAMRHLFATYVEDGGSSRITDGALLADFFLLFVEGCVFIVAAAVVSATEALVWVICSLLVLDSIWGVVAGIGFSGAQAQSTERKWAVTNICTAAVIIIILAFAREAFSYNVAPWRSQLGLFMILLVRTIFDYSKSWEFYFPPRDEAENTDATT